MGGLTWWEVSDGWTGEEETKHLNQSIHWIARPIHTTCPPLPTCCTMPFSLACCSATCRRPASSDISVCVYARVFWGSESSDAVGHHHRPHCSIDPPYFTSELKATAVKRRDDSGEWRHHPSACLACVPIIAHASKTRFLPSWRALYCFSISSIVPALMVPCLPCL